MMMKNLTRAALVAAVAAFGLAACGGGGDSSGTTATPAPSASTDEVPAAASQSVAGLMSWASTLPQNDTATPLATDKFQPPVDDTAQPMPV
jgi:ABC-type glycerol-3-phosphate transport system substrate-binding protein